MRDAQIGAGRPLDGLLRAFIHLIVAHGGLHLLVAKKRPKQKAPTFPAPRRVRDFFRNWRRAERLYDAYVGEADTLDQRQPRKKQQLTVESGAAALDIILYSPASVCS